MSIYVYMGGEAGIGGIGGTEGGVPPIEKEQRAFDKKVAIKAHQLWKKAGSPKDKGLHSEYIVDAEEIITESEEANARRRKEREDKKKREEPAPGPDIPKAPPDQSGEEIARSEAITQEPAVEQTPSEQQKELASEDSYLEWVRDELNKLDEKGKDKDDEIDIQPAPKLQDIIDAIMPEDQQDERGGEESQEISDEMRLKKLIKRTEEKYGIRWDDMPLDLRLETERDILSNMKPKVTTPTAAVNNFGTETPDNPPVNMAKQESDLESIKRSIFERAGARNAEDVETLISQVEQILAQETAAGQGKLGRNIDETRTGINGQEYFVDGKIAYLPPKGDAVFIGDTHGDSQATESIVKQMNFIENMEKGDKSKILVFLGDYVDRGSSDVGNLEIVLALKEKYPKNVILMMGNHEQGSGFSPYDLPESLDNHFGKIDGNKLHEKYAQLFNKLPNMVIAANGIVAIHGGVPKEEIHNLHELRGNEQLFYQMRWNDPNSTIETTQISKRGDGAYEFGDKTFNRFMDAIGGKIMVRSHEYPPDGYKLFFNNRLVTIFSNGGVSSESYYSGRVQPKIMTASLVNPIDKITPQNLLDVKYS